MMNLNKKQQERFDKYFDKTVITKLLDSSIPEVFIKTILYIEDENDFLLKANEHRLLKNDINLVDLVSSIDDNNDNNNNEDIVIYKNSSRIIDDNSKEYLIEGAEYKISYCDVDNGYIELEEFPTIEFNAFNFINKTTGKRITESDGSIEEDSDYNEIVFETDTVSEINQKYQITYSYIEKIRTEAINKCESNFDTLTEKKKAYKKLKEDIEYLEYDIKNHQKSIKEFEIMLNELKQ